LKIGEYDGTLKLLKQPKINGLISHFASTDIFALKVKKGVLQVEEIHLDPEQDRTSQTEKGAKIIDF